MFKTDKMYTHPNSRLLGAFEIPTKNGEISYLVKTIENEHFICSQQEYVQLSKPIL